ncbi:hypothetical protein CDN99_26045 [Roseateles aquatilis]|uniref:DNA 5'-3' helicase n=1 Tax=Roseateles aquatilis TaxID=431061 RepID=A0A246ITQ3_9BURK|nr:DnaB-like helicase C-terminal domain-containing protein [Roseateles aquatilis]OWQ83594.1 hypothetical protein CDN99_26045 [Roseateles aquatilis]
MKRLDVNELPWSAEAEQSVLGGLLIDNAAWDRCADLLKPASFFDFRHGAIFSVIGSMVLAQKPADVVTVFERLQAEGQVEECGGLAYLNALAQSVPSASNVRRYAEIVAEKAAHRALMQTADEALTVASGHGSYAEKVDRIATQFASLQQTGLRSMPVRVTDLLGPSCDRYNDLAAGNVPPGVSTGIVELDKALGGGLREGKVIVIAARPGVGKSSLSEQILLSAAKAGHVALFLSQEMERDELTDRAVSNLGGIGFSRLQNGNLTDAEWSRLGAAVDALAKLPLYFDDQAALTLQDIRAKAMSLRRDGLRVLVVDYIQLCAGARGARTENRNAEIEEISRGLKKLAKDLKLTVLVLSQLNRKVESRATPEPTLADLRDSGAIEQDADGIVFLWKVRVYEDRKLIALSVPKLRNGQDGARLGLDFQGYYQRWQISKESIASSGDFGSRGGFDS